MRGERMRPVFMMLLVVSVLALGAVTLGGCESADNAAARRANAESSLVRAEAEAYARRVAADESRRENGHQRALETLPFVVLILGGLLLAAFGAFIVWDRVRQTPRSPQAGTVDSALLLYLERLRLDQTERDRQLWQAIAHLDRRNLPVLRTAKSPQAGPAEERREVTIYGDRTAERN
jgi:hypothetical protein